ncbi:hypothetical protein A9Q96_16940 [Rhodobacterales bacterium 52_120_T64]|nr:hypothetical protein A9Q96_16940 [Rhodobacterales bacterium 52_120_T64]
MVTSDSIETLTSLWWSGVNAVGGCLCVNAFFAANPSDPPTLILAVGKAAEPMYLAAADHFARDIPFFIATKYNHLKVFKKCTSAICSGHPTPDENSVRAGRELLRRVREAGPKDRLLFLVSGGASAIAELPEEGLTLTDIALQNEKLVSGGLAIGEINAARQITSQVKAGKLLAHFNGASILTLGLSDVEGDGIDLIGSGIGALPAPKGVDYHCEIVGSNQIARVAVQKAAEEAGLSVRTNQETLYCDVEVAAKKVVGALRDRGTGIWIFGGEPTVALPPNPGKGGRNQALALIIAREISGMQGITVLVAGTDGTDGPTDAAGAIVDGSTWTDSAQEALHRADAWTWLNAHGGLFVTGPTGTNIMDLIIAIKV